MTIQELYVVLSSLPKDMHDAPVWIQNGPVFTPVRALVVVPAGDEQPDGRVSLVTGWVVTPQRKAGGTDPADPKEPDHIRPEQEGGGS